MVRDYELMYIVRPELDDEALRTATESVDTLIRGLGARSARRPCGASGGWPTRSIASATATT